ncbi:HlyD family efflux transporter periplasmic adaptor subunit [Salinimonas marina]|uniref:HlyD family efflux transporter periplasmic adaptor subunit n=1 Tax=Salinimonas marina TaxID=2785918 RepID=A0A7S9HDC2_9ALTE|nr:HlyD family efflux transporter periplasmic adaptor subunit [Salinimonas marina]QPG05974.1 HlyD family efflux transporter periplasmic adaptor subunit [Salinimonas marina]
MRNGLFRPQALAAQGPRLHGSVFIQPSMRLGVIASAIVLWSAATITYLSQAQYSRQATVSGWLEPPAGIVKVYADQPGSIIQAVLVTEGQQVRRGEPLIALTVHHNLADGRVAQQSLQHEYQQQLLGLDQQIAYTGTLYQHKHDGLTRDLAALNNEHEALARLKDLAQSQLLLAQRHYQRLAPLSGIHVASREVDAAYAAKLSAEQSLGDKQQALAALTRSLAQTRQALEALPLEQHNALAAFGHKSSEIRQQLVQLQSQSQRILRASRDGVVSNLVAFAGHSQPANTPLLTLTPPDQQVRARFAIPVRAAGFVTQGQQLALRYDAYPYQKFGLHGAVITTLSSAAMLPSEVGPNLINFKEPVYLAEARLEAQQLQAYGQPVTLKSGMTFTADIALGERSLLEWLLEPLLTLSGRLAV